MQEPAERNVMTAFRIAIVVSKYHDFVTDRLQTRRACGAVGGRR